LANVGVAFDRDVVGAGGEDRRDRVENAGRDADQCHAVRFKKGRAVDEADGEPTLVELELHCALQPLGGEGSAQPSLKILEGFDLGDRRLSWVETLGILDGVLR
jgi:hypothetical protein